MVMGVCLQDDDTHSCNQMFVPQGLQENGTSMHMDHRKEMNKLKMGTGLVEKGRSRRRSVIMQIQAL